MTHQPIAVRTEHPAEWLAALPVLVGYELDDRSTLTFIGETGQMVCLAAVPHSATTAQLIAILRARGEEIRREGARATWTAVHGLDQADSWVRSQVLADAVAAAGLPRPHPTDQFAVLGNHAWPIVQPRAGASVVWDLTGFQAARDRIELLVGAPAGSRDSVGMDLAAAPSPLRSAIAQQLPTAASDPAATRDPARWRVAAAATTLADLTDPRPWAGKSAAAALLALSDRRVLANLMARTLAVDPHTLSSPDTGRLADLVRSAPPGLVAGPATLLAGRLASQGLTSARARTAAQFAVADRPDATVALALLAALNRGDNPRGIVSDLIGRVPTLDDDTPPLFTSGDSRWPDPLAPGLGQEHLQPEKPSLLADPLADPGVRSRHAPDRPDGLSR